MEKERKEDEAREQEAAAEQLRSGGKEAIYNTEGAKEADEEQMGVGGGAEAKELKTQNNQDAKEEEKMSLPMNSQLQQHGQHGQRDGCSSTEKQKEQESRTKMPCIYGNCWAARPVLITKGGTGTAAVAAGAGDRGSDQNQESVECGTTFHGTWVSGKLDGNKYQ